MSFNGCGCLFFIGSTIVVALFIPLIMWLSVITADESLIKCSIQDFFIPSMTINGAQYSLNTSSIFFDLQLTEEATEMGVYYDNLTLIFSYIGTPDSIIPVANYTLPGFYQKGGQHGATTHRSDYVTTRAVDEVSKNESSYLLVVFRVDLATAVRFKYSSWTSKKHKVVVRGDVEVNGVTGKKESKKSIKLKPYAGHHHSQTVYTAVYGISISIYTLLSLVWIVSICLLISNYKN